MRILLHTSVRLFGESLAACLGVDENVTAVLVEHNPTDVAARMDHFRADVILVDVASESQLPMVRLLTGQLPNVPMVALAVPLASSEVIACADAGFISYVPRNASLPELIAILEMAVKGESNCDPRTARALFEEIHRRRDRDVRDVEAPHLTPRECETMRLVSRGLSNKEIAGELHLSVATVKNHVHSVLLKLRLTRRSEVSQLLHDRPWLALGAPSNSSG